MASALKRATQMGDFEVAKGGGIWVANREEANGFCRAEQAILTAEAILTTSGLGYLNRALL